MLYRVRYALGIREGVVYREVDSPVRPAEPGTRYYDPAGCALRRGAFDRLPDLFHLLDCAEEYVALEDSLVLNHRVPDRPVGEGQSGNIAAPYHVGRSQFLFYLLPRCGVAVAGSSRFRCVAHAFLLPFDLLLIEHLSTSR
jgi:hypothetical protein